MPQPAPCGVASVGAQLLRGRSSCSSQASSGQRPSGPGRAPAGRLLPQSPGGGGGGGDALETGQGALWPWPAPCTL